jgi:hypothetical protein
MRPSSADVTSARHSSRPLRIRRNSSVPLPTTAPTVACAPRSRRRPARAPASGQPHLLRCKRAARRHARLGGLSAVRYWLICEALIAPVCLQRAGPRRVVGSLGGVRLGFGQRRLRLRRVGAAAVSAAKRASTWPRARGRPR